MTNRRTRGAGARARIVSVLQDRLNLSLALIFLTGAAFYLWTAATSYPLSLTGGQADAYNELAKAFLHLHLAVAEAPAGLSHLADPYDPAQNMAYQGAFHDLALYHGRLYVTWGPAPVVVLLVPLHLLGLAPSSSLTVALFAIAGLAFALGTLRVILGVLDRVPLWMGILAAAALVCCTTMPFLLRRPLVYEEAIAGGFCFAMAGLLIAVRTIAQRRASLWLLGLMSLCFGLAAGSRPPLAAIALLLVPVFLALRGSLDRRPLLLALALPFGICAVLLLAYNVIRFGNPLEGGQSYQLTGIDLHDLHFGSASYLLPNLWGYVLSPPKPQILFPFLVLEPSPFSYPLSVPADYVADEITGGVLTMTPLLLFALALPWLRGRAQARLGGLATPMLVAAGAGLLALLFLSYEFYGSTERYEGDFAGVFLLAALLAWLGLATGPPSRRRKAVRVVGAVLAIWGCLTGLAIGFTGYFNILRLSHPGTMNTLQGAGSPISTAVAELAGRPILAEVQAPNLGQVSPVGLTTIGTGVVAFWLPPATPAHLTIVSPDRREAAIVATISSGGALGRNASLSVQVDGSLSHYDFPIAEKGRYTIAGNGLVRLPVKLKRGINRVNLTPRASAVNTANPAVLTSQQLLIVSSLTIAGHY
jgi:hypothetical protein